MSTPGYPDFTQPVALVERDVYLANATLTSGQSYHSLDVSGFQCVAVTLSGIGIGSTEQQWQIVLQWEAGGGIVFVEQYTVDLCITGVNGITGNWVKVPCKGAALTVTATSNNGANQAAVSVIGSTRADSTPRYASNVSTDNRVLYYTGSINVPATSTVSVFVPPVGLQYGLHLFASGNNLTYQYSAVSFDGNAFHLRRIFAVAQPATEQSFTIGPCPGMGGRLDIVNTTAGALNAALALWDATP